MRLFFKRENFEKAELEFKNVIKIDAHNPAAHVEMARLKTRSGDLQAAANHYFTAVEKDPTLVEANIGLAQIMIRAGNYQDALKYSAAAIEAAPDDAKALALRASALYRSDDVAGALDSANAALAKNPGEVVAASVLVAEALKSGGAEAAIPMVDKFIAAERENSEDALGLYVAKLGLVEQTGDQGAIGAHLKASAEAFPDNLAFRQALGSWHQKSGDQAAAEAEFRAVADRKSDDPNVVLALVRYIGETRGVDAARDELNARIAAASDPFPYKAALAGVDYESGAKDAAKASLSALIADEASAANADTARLQLARWSARDGDPAAARDLVDAVLANDDKNVDALALDAALKLSENDVEGAVLAVREALNESPNNASLLRLAANAYHKQGRSELATDALSAAVAASNYAPVDVLRYAEDLLRAGNQNAAEIVLAEAARQRPNEPSVLVRLAGVQLGLSQWAAAEATAAKLATLDGGDVAAQRIRAAALSGQDRFDESIEILSDVVDPAAEDFSSLAQLVDTFVRSGRSTDAISAIDQALSSQPENVAALILKSRVAERGDDLDAAEQSLVAAVRTAPTSARAVVDLSRFYSRQGRLDEAERVARGAIETASIDNPDAVSMQLAMIMESQQNVDGAIGQYEALLESRPGSLIAANNLASLLGEHRADDSAELARALEIAEPIKASDEPAFQDTYGWLLYLTGDYPGALERLERAMQALPENAWVRFHVGMTYAKLGEAEAAREHLTKALEFADASGFTKSAEASAALEALPTAQ